MVRFCAPHYPGCRSPAEAGPEESEKPWLVGLLVEYRVWEKIATIMYDGQLVRVHANVVEKAGKKDFNSG